MRSRPGTRWLQVKVPGMDYLAIGRSIGTGEFGLSIAALAELGS
jgi:hypothetical protein